MDALLSKNPPYPSHSEEGARHEHGTPIPAAVGDWLLGAHPLGRSPACLVGPKVTSPAGACDTEGAAAIPELSTVHTAPPDFEEQVEALTERLRTRMEALDFSGLFRGNRRDRATGLVTVHE